MVAPEEKLYFSVNNVYSSFPGVQSSYERICFLRQCILITIPCMHTQVPAIERFSHNAAMPPHVGIVMKLGLLSLTAVQFIEMRSLSLSLSLPLPISF